MDEESVTVCIDEQSTLRMTMEYLRKREYYEALSSLMLETGVSEVNLCDDMLYLQRLTLQGRWENVLLFLAPLRQYIVDYDKVEHAIHKQQYLEALSWQGGGGHNHARLPWYPKIYSELHNEDIVDVEKIVVLLRSLEKLCPAEEFNTLCRCLTLERLNLCEDYSSWTVSFGRIRCLYQLLLLLNRVINKMEMENLHETSISLPEDVFREEEQKLIQNQRYRQQWLERVVVSMGNKGQQCSDSTIGLLTTISLALAYQKDCSIQFNNDNISTNQEISCCSYGIKNFEHGCVICCANVELPDIISTAPPVKLVNTIAPVAFKSQDLLIQHGNTESNSKVDVSIDKSRGVHNLAEVAAAKRPKPVAWTVDVDKYASKNNPPTNPNQSQGLVSQVSSSPKYKQNVDMRGQEEIVGARESISALEIAAQQRQQILNDIGSEVSTPAMSARSVASTAEKRASSIKQPTGPSKPALESNPKKQIPVQPSVATILPIAKVDIADDERSAFSASTQHSARSRGPPTQLNSDDSVKKQSRVQAAEESKSQFIPGLDLNTARVEVLVPSVLLECDCPLRCVVPIASPIPSTTRNPQFSCDSIAVGSNSKSLHLLPISPSTSEPTVLENIHNGSIYSMDWSFANRVIVTGSNDKTLKLINIDNHQISSSIKGHNGTIRIVRVQSGSGSGSGAADLDVEGFSYFASGGAGDCKVRVWDVQTGSLIETLSPHPDAVHGLAWLNPSLLVSGCDRGMVFVHDLRQPDSVIFSMELPSNPLVPSKNVSVCCLDRLYGQGMNSVIGVGGTNGVFSIIDLRDGLMRYHNVVHKDDVRAITSTPVGWIPKEQASISSIRICTTSYDSTGNVWNLSVTGSEGGCKMSKLAQFGHSGKILSINPVITKNAIVTSGADGKVLLWKSNLFQR